MNATLETIRNILTTLATVAIVPILGAVAKYVIAYYNKKEESVDSDVKINQHNHYLKILSNSVTDAVNTVNQTYVDNLKKKGEFKEENYIEAIDKATTIIEAILPREVKNGLKEGLTEEEWDEFLSAKIESFIKQNKEKADKKTDNGEGSIDG